LILIQLIKKDYKHKPDENQVGDKVETRGQQAGNKPAISWQQVSSKIQISKEAVKQILETCKSEKSVLEVMKIFNLRERAKFKAKYLNPLLNYEFLGLTNPNKITSPNQKYFTTEKGKELLEGLKK